MAHNQYSILNMLLKDIDDERNDIYVHIDKKSRSVPWENIKKSVNKARLFLVERINVNWGGYTQIVCEIHLLENARKNGPYQYYHFLCGTEYPLKSQSYIHQFFNEHNGEEFIEYDEKDVNYMKRVQYYHIFNECGRPGLRNIISFFEDLVRRKYLEVQKGKNVDLTKGYNYVFKKGNANWSITEDLVDYIISKKYEIKSIYAHSFCADEIYLHTLVYNSSFFEKVYVEAGRTSNARKQQWDREDNCYSSKDVECLIMSSALFARKFCGIEGQQAIEEINKLRNIGEK